MIIKKDGVVIADNVKIADNFFSRLIGLLNRKNLEENEGLLFITGSQIHTFFMRFPIDIIFLDKNKKILKTYNDLKPFRATGLVLKTRYVLELKAGVCGKKGVREGDVVEILGG